MTKKNEKGSRQKAAKSEGAGAGDDSQKQAPSPAKGQSAKSEGRKVVGRPSDYTPEIAAEICARLMRPESLRQICSDPDMPSRSTVNLWLLEYPEFSDQYSRAKAIQADQHADMILEVAFDTQGDVIADEYGNVKPNHEFINRSKLKIDALKWHARVTAPKKYGDKVEQTHVGDPERPVHHEHRVGPTSEEIKQMTDRELLAYLKEQSSGPASD